MLFCLALSLVIAALAVWPRQDGGGVPYSVAQVAPELVWAALLIVWVTYGGVRLFGY